MRMFQVTGVIKGTADVSAVSGLGTAVLWSGGDNEGSFTDAQLFWRNAAAALILGKSMGRVVSLQAGPVPVYKCNPLE